MLIDLKVSNFAIIDNVSISFKNGFNVLSGETGAGKSVLLKSLTLLMGEKSTPQIVRSGSDTATVEGCFDLRERPDIIKVLTDQGINTHDDLIIVRRVISKEGKSRVYINESLSTLGTLQNIIYPLIDLTSHRTPLIEMTSQHENKNLMSKHYHLDLLDHFCGLFDLRTQYLKNFNDFLTITKQLDELRLQSQKDTQRLDYLKFQLTEILSMNLKEGDEIQIENSYKKIKNSSQLIDFISQSEDILFGSENSILVQLHKIIQRSQEFSKLDETLKETFAPLSQSKSLIEDVVYSLRSYTKEIDPKQLSHIEDKMNKLRQLQRKYGPTATDILSVQNKLKNEIDSIENSDSYISSLTKKQKELELILFKQSQDLHKKRSSGATSLANLISKELQELNMKDTEFKVLVSELKDFNACGKDEVEFLTRTSIKEEFRSISKFASGGELSRILLSLKKVVGTTDLPRTFLFDEVDAGVSGPTAEKVGRKLKSISKGQQVICVTHLPQVAAYADSHFLIEKDISKKGTSMRVVELNKEFREKEIARLISGEKITKTSIDHAKQLIKESLI